jgi:phospholipase/lecithinase/hemolysin
LLLDHIKRKPSWDVGSFVLFFISLERFISGPGWEKAEVVLPEQHMLIMKEDIMKKALFFLLAGALLVGCSTQTAPVSHIYAFGDDFVDTGNGLKDYKDAFDQGQMEAWVIKALDATYWEGRASNGPVAVEILAERLEVGLTNYAVWGAESGNCPDEELDIFKNPCLLGQIDKFEADIGNTKADIEALYFIVIGSGDIFWKIDEGQFPDKTYPELADQVVDNIILAITRLAGLGAKHFMIGNMFDLASYPFYKHNKHVTEFQTQINSRLPGDMEKLALDLNIKIDVFDFIEASERIRSNAEQYGLTNLKDACTTAPWDLSYFCENPDEYYYYVSLYPSRIVHQAMGEAMAEQLSK